MTDSMYDVVDSLYHSTRPYVRLAEILQELGDEFAELASMIAIGGGETYHGESMEVEEEDVMQVARALGRFIPSLTTMVGTTLTIPYDPCNGTAITMEEETQTDG